MINNEPLVSVAISCYNSQKYIWFAVQSIINQSYTNWELLLIDDGSTDNTLSILRQFNDSRISIFADGKNKGFPARLNESIRLAKGKYYARMDSDDIMHPERLRTQIDYMESHPQVDVIGSSSYIIDGNNIILRKRITYSQKGFIHPTVTGKLQWFKANLYNENMLRSQDTELWLRTSTYSVFYNITDCLMFYREEGMPQLRKYCQSQWLHIKYLYTEKYGFSVFDSIILRLKALLKIMIFSSLTILGLNKYLIRFRSSQPVLAEELNNANVLLNKSICRQ